MTAGKQKDDGIRSGYVRAVIYGCAAFGVALLLLFFASLLCESYRVLAEKTRLTAIACLTISALLCGCLSAGAARENRFPHALAGEGAFLILAVLLGSVFGFHGGWQSILCDVGIMFFGAFAGTIIRSGIRKRRRGKG